MTEATLQADLQRELLRLTSVFSSGDVTIGDWSVLDGSSLAAPFAIIEVAETFDATTENTWSTLWTIPFTLIIRFTDWDTSIIAVREARATVLTLLQDTTHYSAASTALAWGLQRIISASGIDAVYDRYNENTAESIPVFLSQKITLQVLET